MNAHPAEELLRQTEQLCRAVARLSFSDPVAMVYNPLQYAAAGYRAYVERFARNPKRVLFVGMNPGPWGMAQTGVPFGEVGAVRDWMGIRATIDVPPLQHSRRPIEGLACRRSEVSGRRLWGLMQQRFGRADQFFCDQFVANYCPLLFMEQSGRNRTPEKLTRDERDPLFDACDEYLDGTMRLLQPRFVVGVGVFARARVDAVLQRRAQTGSAADVPQTLTILHPSPANPRANHDWNTEVSAVLEAAGAWPRA
ncbi:MAG: single-stranded DNA-binding protein [Spirochaetaceae bacterium]|nr:MAG: single-stranded DNA-binding protein [Spirochaetaceae bacterium]